MASLLFGERTQSSHEVCVFDDYDSLEAGHTREFIASDLLTPSNHRVAQKQRQVNPEEADLHEIKLTKDENPWVQCRLTRPQKEEFRLCDEKRGQFLLSAKKVGDEFYISAYEGEQLPTPSKKEIQTPTSPTSPRANYAAVLSAFQPAGGRSAVSYRLRLCSGSAASLSSSQNVNKANEAEGTALVDFRNRFRRSSSTSSNTSNYADDRLPLVEIWPASVWSEEQQVELRKLRVRLPRPSTGETPAHYIHDCVSPTRQRRPSQPGGFNEPTLTLQNKLPKWNPQLGCLSLHFGRKRVKASSSKNFLIYTDDVLRDRSRSDSAEAAVFQLGKLGSRTFSLDFRYPFSPLQAFAVALTAFNAKNLPKSNR